MRLTFPSFTAGQSERALVKWVHDSWIGGKSVPLGLLHQGCLFKYAENCWSWQEACRSQRNEKKPAWKPGEISFSRNSRTARKCLSAHGGAQSPTTRDRASAYRPREKSNQVHAARFVLAHSALQCVWDRNTFRSNSRALGAAALLRCTPWLALHLVLLGSSCPTAHTGNHDLGVSAPNGAGQPWHPSHVQDKLLPEPQGAGVSPCFTLGFLSTLQGTTCLVVTSDKLP